MNTYQVADVLLYSIEYHSCTQTVFTVQLSFHLSTLVGCKCSVRFNLVIKLTHTHVYVEILSHEALISIVTLSTAYYISFLIHLQSDVTVLNEHHRHHRRLILILSVSYVTHGSNRVGSTLELERTVLNYC